MTPAASRPGSAPSTSRTRVVAVAVVLGGLLAAGCSGGGGAPGATADEADDRVAAVREARDEVVRPAQELGTAAAAVASRLDEMVAEPHEEEAVSLRSALEDLERAEHDVEAVALEASTEDVRAAQDALGDGLEGSRTLARSAAAVADAVVAGAEADLTLRRIVAGWDEPGSFSQLLARFEDAIAEADQLAGKLEPPAECPGPVDQRVAAAEAVAAATRDLHDLVARRDGLAFDERRAELHETRFGTRPDGQPRRLDAPVAAGTCPALGRAEAAASRVAGALTELQDALNPADLSG